LGLSSLVSDGDGRNDGVHGGGSVDNADSSMITDNGGYRVLLNRPFTIPFQAEGCNIQLLSQTTEYNEALWVRVLSNSAPKHILAERFVPIDDIFEVINSTYL